MHLSPPSLLSFIGRSQNVNRDIRTNTSRDALYWPTVAIYTEIPVCTFWGIPNTSAPGVPSKCIEDYRPGYPRLCALLGAHDGFMMCRRFRRLRARILLLKQDRITCLEEQLDKVDQDEPMPVFLGKSRGDINSERLSVLSQIESAIADYDSFIDGTSRALSSNPVALRDNLSLRNWLNGNGCVSRLETAYLDHEEDLFGLAGSGDRATSQLEAWIEDKLIDYYPSFRTMPSHNVSTDANVAITSMTARLLIIILSTAVYLAVLSALTKARTFELILAGATFATILVVFVSGT
ncbi:hypothetical protein NPX13_g1401 [Xylaria arbuscula]|uniref:DUF6594 domain-containing protein n=1 Tax=Xylaria arbuscula TaxID=114810 RepID=A0A9W8NMH0_9PEZI|nr:hypothetical protein NPX13_g1401 [Xylaria arbuscula]